MYVVLVQYNKYIYKYKPPWIDTYVMYMAPQEPQKAENYDVNR